MHPLPRNFDPTSTTNPVRSGTPGAGFGYLRIAETLGPYGSRGSSGRVRPRARPQRDRTTCTICACRRVCLPACNRGERCSPLDPGWGPVAPTSPRCWSSEDDFNQVRLPTPAPSSPPHSPSARGSPYAWLTHTLLRAAQFATIALHGAQEHLAYALAQLELLYKTIRGSIARVARRRPSLRLPCDRIVCACRRPGAPPAPILRMWTRTCLCT